jgi:hypothetical protein
LVRTADGYRSLPKLIVAVIPTYEEAMIFIRLIIAAILAFQMEGEQATTRFRLPRAMGEAAMT